MTMPNFLVLGAPKAGTTALYHYLNQHPEIYMSPVKEPNFFAFEGKQPYFCGPRDNLAWTNTSSIVNLEAYQALFDGRKNEKAIGEASTLYLYIPETPERIHRYIPDAKLIAILRHPVDRAFSNYLHLRRDRREWIADFELAINEENKRISQHWSPAWYYLNIGLYTPQIKRYLAFFPRSQLKIYLYEDWKESPQKFLQDLFTFLEVDCRFVPDMSAKHNQTNVVWKNIALYDLLTTNNPIKNFFKFLMPRKIRQPMAAKIYRKNMEKPPQLSPQLRQKLIPLFEQDICQLQEIIDRDLSHWLE
ncbi:MAG: sulfotransferase [Oscillatoria sp. PMC 1050.18]|nr:sulfotransferase [Oscillatoria sp. PMC 1050.18]